MDANKRKVTKATEIGARNAILQMKKYYQLKQGFADRDRLGKDEAVAFAEYMKERNFIRPDVNIEEQYDLFNPPIKTP